MLAFALRRARPPFVLALALIVGAGGCVFRTVGTRPVERGRAAPVQVFSPVKLHLTDGSTVVFQDGALITADSVKGRGRRFGLTLADSGLVQAVPFDRVVAAESFRGEVDEVASLLGTLAATPLVVVGVAGLAVALFGSCPTVYADATGDVAQAELFSSSIAPLMEQRDVDRLAVDADASGAVTLEVRNEAVETHYLNHLELLSVEHAADEAVFPAQDKRLFAVRALRPFARATDRTGRDVRALLGVADGAAYVTADVVVAAQHPGDLSDHVDLVAPRPAGDSAAVVLRLRSSLLNTLWLYEYMLAGQGAAALDWLGRDLNSVSTTIELASFYDRRMGLAVQVWRDGAFHDVRRIYEVGPTAWGDVAVPIAVPPGDSLRVRLRFVPDAWRVDHAALAASVRPVTPRRHAVSALRTAASADAPDLRARIAAPDEAYLVTGPGERYHVRFDVGPSASARTFLLAGQGYYVEWMRRDWLRTPAPRRFVPTDSLLSEAITRWRVARPDYERRFESSRLPVR